MMTLKNLDLHSVFQTVFRCLSGDFVIFMALLGGFLDANITSPIIDSLIFLEMKGAKLVRLSCKFHLHLTCSS